ncbi:MAG: hypothetical protein IJ735_01810 [Clostridia bacterium]|nr:hypothetical protein [Clostridia bacterium]
MSLYVFDKLSGVGDIFSALNTFGLFDDKNVIIVSDNEYTFSTQDHAEMEKMDASDAYVLFLNGKSLNDKEKKRFTKITCSKLDKYACAKYSAPLFEYGVEKDALAKLIELTDCDMAKIHIEAQKLIAFAGGRSVTINDVTEVVAEETEAQIFSFTSDVIAGRKERAMYTLEKLQKKGDAPGYILSVLISQYRRILFASLSKKTDAELAAVLKVKEYAIKKARAEKAGGNRFLRRVLSMLVSYEYSFKNGQMSEKAALDAAMERLIGGAV